MRINQIDLHNFRNFEQQSFYFPNLFTVVIGENGKGKSTLLQALRLAAGTFLLGLKESERKHILPEDIRRIDLDKRFAPQFPCDFHAFGQINDQQIEWKRTKNTLEGRTTSAEAKDLITIAEAFDRQINEELNDEVKLPVIVFFSTARLWVEPKQTIKLKTKGSKIKDGYARCLDNRSDKITPFEWIKSNYYKSLKGADSGLLDAVLDAISQCIPNWKATEWDEDYDDLMGIYTHENGSESRIPLFYLSDGLRIMAGIAAEIAYRCVMLNDHLGSQVIKQSEGIVLIDELDMHLHPNWQRHVVSDLKAAFPKLQFVATTHSPFIVQSLESSELINLDSETDIQPKNLSVEEVSESIMGVNSTYSIESEQAEDISTAYFEKLNNVITISDAHQPEILAELDQLEIKISDPAVRAFMQMKRLEKTANK